MLALQLPQILCIHVLLSRLSLIALPQLWLDNDQLLMLLSFSLIIMPQPLPDNVKPPLLQPDNAHLALRLGLEKKKKICKKNMSVRIRTRELSL